MNDACYYRVSVKGVSIDAAGRFLLSKEANGKWELLGGGIDHGENPIACLKREIAEETGLEIVHVSASPIYFVTTQRAGRDTFIANVIYEIVLNHLDFKPSDECQELRYFTVQEARKETVRPNVAKFLDVFDPRLHS